MISKISMLLVFLFVSFGALATAQSPDEIIIDGEIYRLNTNPLESYLEEIQWEPPSNAVMTSANWRGYLGLWRVESGYLTLEDMTIELKRESGGKNGKE